VAYFFLGGLRLLTFVVSVRGALGSEAQTFIRQISAGWRGRCLTGCSTRRAGPRRAVLPSSALRSPSLLAGRLLLASVGAPALPRRPARFAERTDWLGPDPAGCFDFPVDTAPAER